MDTHILYVKSVQFAYHIHCDYVLSMKSRPQYYSNYKRHKHIRLGQTPIERIWYEVNLATDI